MDSNWDLKFASLNSETESPTKANTGWICL